MILAVLLVLVVSFAVSRTVFEHQTRVQVEGLFREAVDATERRGVISEADIAGLPAPVQRYLRYVGAVGHERVTSARLRQRGQLRQAAGEPWLSLSAEQYYIIAEPVFLWQAEMKLWGLPLLKGRDRLVSGDGRMQIRLLPFISVADASGPEIDQGTLMRFLNEIMWFPTAYLEDYITWEAIDSYSARARISAHGVRCSAVLSFDQEGRMTGFVGQRYMSTADGFRLENWSTPISNYKNMDGLLVPTEGTGVWKLPEGDFTYVRLRVTDMEYNVPRVW